MPLNLQNGGAALVAGAALPAKTRLVRVVRPFMFGGVRQDVGAELQLPALFAAEMVASGKAQVLPDPPKPAAPAKAEPTNTKPAKPAKE